MEASNVFAFAASSGGCRPRRIHLPLLVLVRVGVVADAADYEAEEAVYQAYRLYLKVEHAANLSADFISFRGVSYYLAP